MLPVAAFLIAGGQSFVTTVGVAASVRADAVPVRLVNPSVVSPNSNARLAMASVAVAPAVPSVVQLVVFAFEGVAAAVDPVGPRRKQLAGAMRRELIGVEAGDKVGVAEPEAAQAGTKLGDRRPIVACLDLVLGARERDRHGDQHTDPGCPVHRPVAGRRIARCTP